MTLLKGISYCRIIMVLFILIVSDDTDDWRGISCIIIIIIIIMIYSLSQMTQMTGIPCSIIIVILIVIVVIVTDTDDGHILSIIVIIYSSSYPAASSPLSLSSYGMEQYGTVLQYLSVQEDVHHVPVLQHHAYYIFTYSCTVYSIQHVQYLPVLQHHAYYLEALHPRWEDQTPTQKKREYFSNLKKCIF